MQKINQSINISRGYEQKPVAIHSKRDKAQQEKRGSFYAGSLNINNPQDVLANKKADAQKKALKGVLDQFKKDMAVDDNIKERGKHQEQLENQAKSALSEIDKLHDMRQDLKKASGIDDDSKEEKDLLLLEKSMDPDQELSKEEQGQLQSIGPLTNYQKTALTYDAMEDVWQQRVNDANQGIVNEGLTIESIKLEKLKSHPMTDAQKEAAKIMEDAYKEISDTLLKQSKDHIDDEMDKNKEKIDDKDKQKDNVSKDEKVKDGEDINPKEKASKQNGQTDNNELEQKNEMNQDQMINDLMKMISNKQIVEDDIKGIMVDVQQ